MFKYKNRFYFEKLINLGTLLGMVPFARKVVRCICYELYRRTDNSKANVISAFRIMNELNVQIRELQDKLDLLTSQQIGPYCLGSNQFEPQLVSQEQSENTVIDKLALFGNEPTFTNVVSQLCTQSQFESDVFRSWCSVLKEDEVYHRKIWEHCYIMQALKERGKLVAGSKGLGFGVGNEPLSAAMALNGCKIVATDIGKESHTAKNWALTGQHASSLEKLNQRGICPNDLFIKNVFFRALDMNSIEGEGVPNDFDFLWSSCALEHLGSIEMGIRFIKNSLACLKHGGVAVHTTEYNVSSNDETLDCGSTVLFRRKDIEKLHRDLIADGYTISLNLTEGSLPFDHFVDSEPCSKLHLKYQAAGYATTSIGLIIEKP